MLQSHRKDTLLYIGLSAHCAATLAHSEQHLGQVANLLQIELTCINFRLSTTDDSMCLHIFFSCVCVAFVISEFLSFTQKIARKQMCHRWQHKDAYTEVNYVTTNGKNAMHFTREAYVWGSDVWPTNGNRKLIKFQMDHLLLPPVASSRLFFAWNFKWPIDLFVDSAAGVSFLFYSSQVCGNMIIFKEEIESFRLTFQFNVKCFARAARNID